MRQSTLAFALAALFHSGASLAQTAPSAPTAPVAPATPPAKPPKAEAPKAEPPKAEPPKAEPPPADSQTPSAEGSQEGTKESGQTPAEQAPTAEQAAAPAAADAGAATGAAAEAQPNAEPTPAEAPTAATGETTTEAAAAEKTPAPTDKEAAPKEAAPRSATARPETPEEPADDAGLVAEQQDNKRKRFSLGIMLDMSVPVGNTASFIGSAGLQGFSVDLRYFLNDNIGVGVGAGFDGLSKKLEGTFVWDNLVVDAVHTRQANFTPLVAKGIYRFPGKGMLTPYLAAGFGAARASERILVGFTTLSRDAWHMALVPEAGVQLQVSKATLLGAVRFNYLPGTKSAESQSFVNVSVGVAIQ